MQVTLQLLPLATTLGAVLAVIDALLRMRRAGVGALLAILELYKRGMADVEQEQLFGDIVITHIDDEEAARRGLPDREE